MARFQQLAGASTHVHKSTTGSARRFNSCAYRSTQYRRWSGSNYQEDFAATRETEEVEDDDVHELNHKILFNHFCHALTSYTKLVKTDQLMQMYRQHAYHSELPATQLKSNHEAFWRAVYRDLRIYATAKGSASTAVNPLTLPSGLHGIPTALEKGGPITDPPIHDLNLILVDEAEAVSCPCCLDTEDLLSICLRSDDAKKSLPGTVTTERGITFDVLLQRLSEAMYGHEDGTKALIGDREDLIYLDGFDWMIDSGGLYTNEIYVYVGGCSRWK